MEQIKKIVFADSNLFNTRASHSYNEDSNSSFSISIIVGLVSPNGTQVSSYGNISNSNPTKVDGNTIFDIASISKTFVATILEDMVNQGLVSLDDPVEKFMPRDNVTIPSYDGNKITLENLATHTSGMPDFPSGWIRNHSYTTQQVYDFISNTTLATKSGAKASYSDIGMGLLGHILSLRSGLSFDQLVKERILNLLDMDSTGIRICDSKLSVPKNIESKYAQDHITGKEVGLEFVPETIQSAGSMYSSTNDMLKYLSVNLGLIQSKISDSIKETQSIRHPFGQSSENKVLEDYVGSGWMVTTDFGKEVIWHTGSIDGFTSIIEFNPSKQIGVVVLCGCDYNDFSTQDMVNLIIPFLLFHK